MGRCDVRVGGIWLSGVTPFGNLEWIHRWPGGCFEATWSISNLGTPGRTLPRFLRRGQLVEVFAGSRVWMGTSGIAQPTEDGWSMTAAGLAALGEEYDALTAAGASTSTPDVAIDAAIARGLPWKRRQSFSAVPFVDGDTTDGLNKLSALLDAWSDEAGVFWGVDADGYVFHAPLPTSPTWLLPPQLEMPGSDDAEYADELHVRYIRSTDGTYQTAFVHDLKAHDAFGHAEAPVDLTELGPITTARATALGNGIMAKGRARLGWTDSVEPGPYDLTTLGGVSADPRHVHPMGGVVVRKFGAMDPTSSTPKTLDVVLGETRYSDAERRLVLSPMDKATSTLTEAIEAATRGARS